MGRVKTNSARTGRPPSSSQTVATSPSTRAPDGVPAWGGSHDRRSSQLSTHPVRPMRRSRTVRGREHRRREALSGSGRCRRDSRAERRTSRERSQSRRGTGRQLRPRQARSMHLRRWIGLQTSTSSSDKSTRPLIVDWVDVRGSGISTSMVISAANDPDSSIASPAARTVATS